MSSSMNNRKILGTKGAKRRTSAEQAAQIRSEILSALAYANAQVPVERRVTPKTVLSVAWRELNKSRGLSFSARRDGVLLEVSDFIQAAQGDLTLAAGSRHRDLLPVSHPLSTSKRLFAMTASAVKSSRTAWLLADTRISDEARPLIAAAFNADEDSAQFVYSVAGLKASGNYEVYEALVAAFGAGDGNSYWARSMRAKLQRRDRYGRFAYMGGGVRVLVRNADGSVSWLTGRVVGMDSKSNTYDLEAPDGKIYRIPAGDAEGLKAVLDAPGTNGFSAPFTPNASDEKNIINISDLAEISSPAGWDSWGEAQTMEDGTKFQSFRHESGEYSVGVFTKPDGSREYAIRDEKDADSGRVLARVGSWADVATALRTNTSNKEKRAVKARLADEGLQALEGEDLAGMLDDGDPAKDIRLDSAGDIEAQVNAVIDGGDNLEFNYNGKNRRLTPIRIEDGRDGARNLLAIGKDGKYKKFNLASVADFNDSDPMSEESLDAASAFKAPNAVDERLIQVPESKAPALLADPDMVGELGMLQNLIDRYKGATGASEDEARTLLQKLIGEHSGEFLVDYLKSYGFIDQAEADRLRTHARTRGIERPDTATPTIPPTVVDAGDVQAQMPPTPPAVKFAQEPDFIPEEFVNPTTGGKAVRQVVNPNKPAGAVKFGSRPEDLDWKPADPSNPVDVAAADAKNNPFKDALIKPAAPASKEPTATEAPAAPDLSSIIAKTLKFKGLTIRPNGEMPEDGIVVAVRGTNKEIPADDFFSGAADEQIADWIAGHAEQLDAGGEFFIGTWFDEENNEVVLDVAERFTDRDEAIQAGRDRNQQKIYDIGTGELIDTGGTGDRAAEQQETRSGDDTAPEGQEIVGDESRGTPSVRQADERVSQPQSVVPSRAADELAASLDEMIYNLELEEGDSSALQIVAGFVRDGVLPSGYSYEDLALITDAIAAKVDEGDLLELVGYEDDLRDISDYIRGYEDAQAAEEVQFEEGLDTTLPTFTAPAGMYQIDLQNFDPAQDEDPARLANTFDDQELLDAFQSALESDGSVLLDFNDGEGEVPVSAEALYYAIDEKGYDAEGFTNKVYDLTTDAKPDTKDGDIADLVKKPKSADDVDEEYTKPAEADDDADYEEKPSADNLPPLLQSLTEEELQQLIDSNFDHTPFLPMNKPIEMPEGYHPIVLEPFPISEITTVEEGDENNVENGFPVGWTDDPYWIANNFKDNERALLDAFEASFKPDNPEPGSVFLRTINEDGEPFDAWVDARAVRDALQLQGWDTNDFIQNIADAGFAGQRGDNSDLTDGDMDAMIDGEGIDINEPIEGDAPEEVLPARAQEAAPEEAAPVAEEVVSGWESSTINWGGDEVPAYVKTINGVKYAAVKAGNTHYIVMIGRDGKPYDLSRMVNERKLQFVNTFDSDNPAAFDAFMKAVAFENARENRESLISSLKNAGFDQSVIDLVESDASVEDIRTAIEADPRFAELQATHQDYMFNPRGNGVAETNRRRAAESAMFQNIRSGSSALVDAPALSDEEKSLLTPNIGYPNNVISGTRVESIVQDAFDGKDIPTTTEELIEKVKETKPKTKKTNKSPVPAKSDAAVVEELTKKDKKDKKESAKEVDADSPEADEAFRRAIIDTEGNEIETAPEVFPPSRPIDGRVSLNGAEAAAPITVDGREVTARLLPRYDGNPEVYEVRITDPENPKSSMVISHASTLEEARKSQEMTAEGLRNGSVIFTDSSGDPNYGVEADDITDGDASPYVKNRALQGSPFERFRVLGNKKFQKWREENYIYADGRNQARLGDRVVHFYEGFNEHGEGRIVGWETIQNAGDRMRKGYAYVQFDDGYWAIWATDMMFLNGRAPNSKANRAYDPPSGETVAERPYLDPNRVQQVALTNRYIVEKRREGTVLQPYTSIDKRTWKAETRRAYDMLLRRKAAVDAYRESQGLPIQPEYRLRPRGELKHFAVWVRSILTRDDGGDNAGGLSSIRGQRSNVLRQRAQRIVDIANGTANPTPSAVPAAPTTPRQPAASPSPALTTQQLVQFANDVENVVPESMRNARLYGAYDVYANEVSIGNEMARFVIKQDTDGVFKTYWQNSMGVRSMVTTHPDKDSALDDLKVRFESMARNFASNNGLNPRYLDSRQLGLVEQQLRDKLSRHGAVVDIVPSYNMNIIDVTIPDTQFRYRIAQDNLSGNWSSFILGANGAPVGPVGQGDRIMVGDVINNLDKVIGDTLSAMSTGDVLSDHSPDGFLADRWLERQVTDVVPLSDVDFTGLAEGVRENDPNRVDPNPSKNSNGNPVTQGDFIQAGWTPRKSAEIAHAGNTRPSFEHILDLQKQMMAARSNNDSTLYNSLQKELKEAFARGMGHGDTVSGIKVSVFEVEMSNYGDGSFSVRVGLNLTDANGNRAYDGHYPYRTFKFQNGKIVDIENDYLRMKKGVTGAAGFSSAYNNHCENWYIANGAPQITVHAMGGQNWTGSFVWALTGFNWQSASYAAKMMNRVQKAVEATPQGSRARKDFDVWIAKAANALGVAPNIDDVRVGLSNTRTLPRTFPTPKNLALVGWTPREALKGSDKGSWAGKKGMLVTDWYGTKNLVPDAPERREQIAYDDMKFFRKLYDSGKTDFKANPWLKKLFPADMREYTGDKEILAQFSDELSDLMTGRGKRAADGTYPGTRSVSMLSPAAKAALTKYLTESLLSGSYRSGGSTAAAKRKDEENAAAMADMLGALHRDTAARYPSRLTMSTRGQQLMEIDTTALDAIGETETPIIVNGADTGFVAKRLGSTFEGISQAWKVVDSSTGETFYIKNMDTIDQGGESGVNAEISSNVVARAMNLIGVGHVAKMKNNPNMMITSEVASTVAVPELPTSVAGGQTNRLIRLSDNGSLGDVASMDAENAIGMGLLDIIIANDDRHDANIMMIRGRSVDGSENGAGSWIPVPFDHGFANVLNEHARNYSGNSIEIDDLLGSDNYSTTHGWMVDYMEKLGPVAFKMIVDRRLDMMMDRLRDNYGGYLTQAEMDAVMSRAQSLRDMTPDMWQEKLS